MSTKTLEFIGDTWWSTVAGIIAGVGMIIFMPEASSAAFMSVAAFVLSLAWI